MIFLELIPNNLDQLLIEIQKAQRKYPVISGINVPDIKRISNRSYDAADALLTHNIDVIPHIRTQDDDMKMHVNRIEVLIKKGLTKLLLVTGDTFGNTATSVTPIQLTKRLKTEFPTLKIYTALDPYRQTFDDEISYAEKKLDAGADGFFTQPFFDPSVAEKYMKKLNHCDLFIGLSPVVTQKSKEYWKNYNKVDFPEKFQLNIEYNCKLGQTIISMAKHYNKDIYLMPIKVNIELYLETLLNQ